MPIHTIHTVKKAYTLFLKTDLIHSAVSNSERTLTTIFLNHRLKAAALSLPAYSDVANVKNIKGSASYQSKQFTIHIAI